MSSIGKKISELRKVKGYTQEELAELSKINLRTIQRIENNESEPRGKTLNLICDVLEVNIEEFIKTEVQKNRQNFFTLILNFGFYILLNLILMLIIGYLTLDSEANLNSKIGAFLLSFFIPFYIVYLTPNINPTERVLKFGFGYFSYIIMLLSVRGLRQGVQSGMRSGLFLCLIIAIAVLFYGNTFLKSEK